ncbi:hypothetical protein F4604DRAFT_1779868 [Suillus subluteus]|nr:hypothetical protein F4604DRAFT_1779868 [Suillus subluteus]
MGTDVNSLLNSPIGQPMAQIFFNSFGQNGTLALWSFVVLAHFTKTPVNTVWFVAIISIILGMLSSAGSQAIDAIFALSVTALYIAYAIPMIARFVFTNNFKPGPFNLGGILTLSIIWYYCPVYVPNIGKGSEGSMSSVQESEEKDVDVDVREVPAGT